MVGSDSTVIIAEETSPSLRLGTVELANPVILAPMSGVTDAVLRRIAHRCGAGLVVSEMVASDRLATGDEEARLRAQLVAWRDNDAKLQPLAQRSFLVKEVSASSQDLSTLGTVGLAALEFIAKGQQAPDDWKAQQLALIQQIQKPKGQLLLMPAPAVQKLIEAASTGGTCSAPH